MPVKSLFVSKDHATTGYNNNITANATASVFVPVDRGERGGRGVGGLYSDVAATRPHTSGSLINNDQ